MLIYPLSPSAGTCLLRRVEGTRVTDVGPAVSCRGFRNAAMDPTCSPDSRSIVEPHGLGFRV